MGRGGHPLAGECIGADASDGHQHAYDVEEGTRLAEEVAGEEDHDKPPDSVEHGVRRHLYGPRPKAVESAALGGLGPAAERRRRSLAKREPRTLAAEALAQQRHF